MRLVFLPSAKADLFAIAKYIGRDSRVRALSFVKELRQSCSRLLDMPRAWPLVPRHERHGIRRRVHGNYLIFHRIEVDRIEILHILRGAMDVEAVLFPQG